jgi:ATP-binding cassette subfamily B protein
MSRRLTRSVSTFRRSVNGERRTTTRGFVRTLTQMNSLGVTSLGRQLSWIAVSAFLSGLAQAGVLVIISEFAVNSAQGKNHLQILNHSFSVAQAVGTCVALLILYCFAGLAAAFGTSSVSSRALEMARASLIDRFFNASWRLQSGERIGNLQQLVSFNSEKVGEITLALAAGLQSFLTLVALLCAALFVNPVAAIFVLVFGFLLAVILRPFSAWGRRASAELSKNNLSMSTLVTEYSGLVREFRLFGVMYKALDRLHTGNKLAARTNRQMRSSQQLLPIVYQTVALSMVVGAFAIIGGHAENNLGAIAAVLLLILRSLQYGSNTQNNVQLVRSYGGFLETIGFELDRFSENSEGVGGDETPENFGVRLSEVAFSYDGRENALKGISFDLPDGQILGVVGRSGSGKTTLSQLLVGLLKPDEGTVLAGDVPSSSILKGDGTSPIALVAQEPVLLHGTVASNIAFFRDLDRKGIEAASSAAHLHDDVLLMPDSYDTEVGEGGGTLSGGQRQRLAIARALAGGPKLLVLDEPTSAIDSRSEQLIRQTLFELHGEVTIVIITHRPNLISGCDLLLVLEKGRIAAFGPSSEVIASTAYKNVVGIASS